MIKSYTILHCNLTFTYSNIFANILLENINFKNTEIFYIDYHQHDMPYAVQFIKNKKILFNSNQNIFLSSINLFSTHYKNKTIAYKDTFISLYNINHETI